MTREEQILNGFTKMMKGFWNNQDLEVPNLQTPCKQEEEKMNDLIGRQAAIDAHCELCGDKGRCNCDICPDVEVFQLLPSSQPEWKSGKWVGAQAYCKHLEEKTGESYIPSGIGSMIYCDQCWQAGIRKSAYCPECGAKMER